MIRATDVTKTYDGTTALDGVSLDFAEGLHCITGPNGSGKTTLMRVLAGLTRPDDGTVERPDSLGYAFQVPNVYPDLTVRENLEVFQSLTGAGGEWRDELVDGLRLAPELDREARNLSGGFRKKLDLALALLKEPPVLVLDEPLADLDPATKRRLVVVATEYAEDHCVLACTHNLEAFADAYETLTVLVDGEVYVHDSAAEVEEGPAETYRDLLTEIIPSE